MVEIRNEWMPEINYANLKEKVLRLLASKPTLLTGNELRFIRTSFEMTLEDFAKRFYVSHPAVIKWESKKDMPTNMNWSTEKDIRLFIYTKLLTQDDFFELYNKLETKASLSNKDSVIDIKELEYV